MLSVAGAFLLSRDNLGPVFIAVGTLVVLATIITTPIMRKKPEARWPYYLICVLDALALGTIMAVSRGIESPFIAFMAAHAFAYGFYLGTRGGFTAAATTTVVLAGSVVFTLFGPPSAKSAMVGTLIAAGQYKLTTNYLLAQAALNVTLVFASGTTGGILGRMFYSKTGRLQDVVNDFAELRARSRKVLENLRDGVLVVDSRGNLLQANPAAVDILGLPDRESGVLQGTPIESAIAQFLADNESPENVEMVLGERIINCRFSRSEADNGVIAVLSDITEATNLRVALEERKRLAIVGRLSATLAHEIRNPLASISGAAEILASGKLPEGKSERMTNLIVSQSKRVSELIDGYLSLARDSDDFPHDPIDFAAFTVEAVESAIHGFAGGVTISFPKHDQPVMVLGNPMRLGQALGNMLRNAVEALADHPGGQVLVELKREGNEVRLSVSDNGPGIPAKRLDRVWEPFYTTRAEGTGLGLYVCRRIAQEHGGRMELQNLPQGGLQVSLILPVQGEDNGG
ncbi:MAG: ATP-binding protein [Candidatus Fermentibacteraceae bacterium]